MMNPVIKAEWVAALRSGKYKQGRGYLKIGNKFCCLGVLCDIHRKGSGNLIKWEKWDSDNNYRYLANPASLPQLVVSWSGLDSSDPFIAPGLTLACLNDGDLVGGIPQATFKQIADVIEATL